MKANLTVFLFCGGFIIGFICFVLLAFHKSQSQIRNSESDSSEDLSTHNTLTNEEVLSLPSCHSFGEQLWLHHTSGECYEVGTQGPCGESMTFYRNPHPHLRTIGFCDCDDIVEVKSEIAECEVLQRPLIYYPANDQCYFVFSQGPCEDGMWLVLNNDRTAACTPNPCVRQIKQSSLSGNDDRFWFSENNSCYLTRTRGYCKAGHILKVVKHSWKPQCQKHVDDDCILADDINIASLECRPGNRLHHLNMCLEVESNPSNATDEE